LEFSITEEQKQFRQEIINFARGNLNKEDELDSFSYDSWRKAGAFGFFGLNVPEKFGGADGSYLDAAIAIEALGYACINNGFVFVVNNHIWVGLNLINQFGSDYLKQKYLPEMVAGNLIGAIAITEADSGSDAYSMTSVAVEKEDGYVLSGSKMFISNGSIADVFVVFAKIGDQKSNLITAFVVEKGWEGVEVGKEIEKMGLCSCPISEVTFKNCRIPKENVLGGVGNGKNIMMSALEWERCYEFACHVGAMQRVMEKCIAYVNQRKQFGKFLSEYQAVTHKIANMKMNIEMSKLMLYKIAWMKDHKKKAFLETSVFKLFVSESYISACKDAMQIFGAYGYTIEYGLEREMRDALACSVYSGTNEMQRNTIYTMAMLDIQ